MLSKERMIELLQGFQQKSEVFSQLFGALGIEFDERIERLEDIRDQLFVDTATWGLDIYEDEYGLPRGSSESLEKRRAIIKAKKRGTGKSDREIIKRVADAWVNGDCEVLFDGSIIIKFNSVYGIPSNLQDLQWAIEEVKPAHLSMLFEFAYLLIGEVDGVMTLNELESQELGSFAGGALALYKTICKI